MAALSRTGESDGVAGSRRHALGFLSRLHRARACSARAAAACSFTRSLSTPQAPRRAPRCRSARRRSRRSWALRPATALAACCRTGGGEGRTCACGSLRSTARQPAQRSTWRPGPTRHRRARPRPSAGNASPGVTTTAPTTSRAVLREHDPLTANPVMVSAGSDSFDPVIAPDISGFLIVWKAEQQPTIAVRAAHLSPDGGVSAPKDLLPGVNATALALARGPRSLLLSWSTSDAMGHDEIDGVLLDLAGAVAGPVMTLFQNSDAPWHLTAGISRTGRGVRRAEVRGGVRGAGLRCRPVGHLELRRAVRRRSLCPARTAGGAVGRRGSSAGGGNCGAAAAHRRRVRAAAWPPTRCAFARAFSPRCPRAPAEVTVERGEMPASSKPLTGLGCSGSGAGATRRALPV